MSHLPVRPSWDCADCGQPYPCSPARVQLAEDYDKAPIALSMYLAAMLHDAARETTAPPAELYERFLAWNQPVRR